LQKIDFMAVGVILLEVYKKHIGGRLAAEWDLWDSAYFGGNGRC